MGFIGIEIAIGIEIDQKASLFPIHWLFFDPDPDFDLDLDDLNLAFWITT